MNIFHLFHFFRHNTVVLTLAEARQNAKSCYLNEDQAGAERWNEIIAKMISSEKSANALTQAPFTPNH